MFKSWRNVKNKNKIKAVFKLQFQATQVPKLKKSDLTISLVPDDVGKPTFKLEKAAVKEGICSWENPIYVSVKLIREPKSEIIHEKIYHFIVANGPSKSGFLGEASIDFVDFLAEPEPSTVSLPLKFANSGAVLHVTIQKIEGATDLRFIKGNRDQTLTKEESFSSQQSNDEENGLDINTPMERSRLDSFDSYNNKHISHGHNSIPGRGNGHRRSNTEWSVTSTSDGSFIESRISPENKFQRGISEDSNELIDNQKTELELLKRQLEITDLEILSLREQVTKNSSQVRELSKEISCLKEERDTLVDECEHLKLQKIKDDGEAESRLRCISEDTSNMIEEIRDELKCERDLSSTLRLQLQKTQESNSNLVLAVKDLNEMLEKKTREISSLNAEIEEITRRDENEDERKQGLKDEIDMLKGRNGDLEKELGSCRGRNEALNMKLSEMNHENESLQEKNREISLKLEQLEYVKQEDEHIDSKRTIEELGSQIERLEEKMKQQSLEFSECLITINGLEGQVKELEKELEEQARVFNEELEAMMQAKTEQEQRAIKAEEDLRRTRWKNAKTAELLQEKCKRLSLDMESKLRENEKMAIKSMAEANDFRMQNKTLVEMIQKTKELKRQEEEKNGEFSMKVEMLETEIEKLKNAATNETDGIIQEWRKERDGMHNDLILARSSNDEKEKMVWNLRKEVEGLSQHYSELQNRFVQEKTENEALRKHVSNLQADIQKKEEDISKILDASNWMGEQSAKEQKLFSSNGHKEENNTKLSDELAYFKSKNTCMERELEEMEERYSEISLKFAEVEGERQQLVMAVRNLKNGKKN